MNFSYPSSAPRVESSTRRWLGSKHFWFFTVSWSCALGRRLYNIAEAARVLVEDAGGCNIFVRKCGALNYSQLSRRVSVTKHSSPLASPNISSRTTAICCIVFPQLPARRRWRPSFLPRYVSGFPGPRGVIVTLSLAPRRRLRIQAMAGSLETKEPTSSCSEERRSERNPARDSAPRCYWAGSPLTTEVRTR